MLNLIEEEKLRHEKEMKKLKKEQIKNKKLFSEKMQNLRKESELDSKIYKEKIKEMEKKEKRI